VDIKEETLGEAERRQRQRPHRVIGLAGAGDVIRSALREEMSCRLIGDDGHFEVHFGYDLYMYVVAREERTAVAEWAVAEDIFTERDFLSPYLPEDDV
jgi:hypothetical protein